MLYPTQRFLFMKILLSVNVKLAERKIITIDGWATKKIVTAILKGKVNVGHPNGAIIVANPACTKLVAKHPPTAYSKK